MAEDNTTDDKRIPDDKQIIVALDFSDEKSALDMISQLDHQLCRVKVGKELFTRCGPALVEKINDYGFEVFLDLKFHDIPNTVAKACKVAADLGVWMLNVHAQGGTKMMEAAREALNNNSQSPLLIAVTILTSMTDDDTKELGYTKNVGELVQNLAELASNAGMDGVVCSSREVEMLRTNMGSDFCLVTPGIRPQGTQLQDQKRVMTPGMAIEAGANYLVIGRPITTADSPGEMLVSICKEIKQKNSA